MNEDFILGPLYIIGAGWLLRTLVRQRGPRNVVVELKPKSYQGNVGDPTLPWRLQLAALSGPAAEKFERHLLGRLVDVEAAVVPLVRQTAPLPAPNAPSFKPGEPQSLAEYDGQDFIPHLQDLIAGMDGAKLTKPQMFIGPPGLGKTLLAKCTANDIFAKLRPREPDFILCLASDVRELKDFDAYIRRAHARLGSVLFIDEIHTIAKADYYDKLLHLFDQHEWQFQGEANATKLNDFTILAGTTDYGQLTAAFMRRFSDRQLEPLSEAQILQIVQHRFDITPEAAALAASRTHQGGAPWEAIALVTDARDSARARGSATVDVVDVERVFHIWKLDRNGLRSRDRGVIHALLSQPKEIRGRTKDDPPTTIYAASEDNVLGMTRVDREAYRQDIRPRLMARGLLVLSSRGQQLTDKALALYGGT